MNLRIRNRVILVDLEDGAGEPGVVRIACALRASVARGRLAGRDFAGSDRRVTRRVRGGLRRAGCSTGTPAAGLLAEGERALAQVHGRSPDKEAPRLLTSFPVSFIESGGSTQIKLALRVAGSLRDE